jgi:predicted nucleic acid-binding protein
MELVDTSVWARKARPAVESWFVAAVEAGDVAMCDAVALEILHSARSRAEYEQIEQGLLAMPWISIEAVDWTRARAVYRELSGKAGGYQRSVQHTDLLIAAAAERAGVMLVHYDPDYDTIADVTAQPTRWAAPRGSL